MFVLLAKWLKIRFVSVYYVLNERFVKMSHPDAESMMPQDLMNTSNFGSYQRIFWFKSVIAVHGSL